METPKRPSLFLSGELDAWIAMVSVLERLPSQLDAELQRDAGVSHFEFQVLTMLADMPGGAMRMAELAEFANCSPSRLSHTAARLETRRWLARSAHPDDKRATLASLTREGRALVERVLPSYVAIVRRLVLDPLGSSRSDQLGDSCRRIMEAILPAHVCQIPSQWTVDGSDRRSEHPSGLVAMPETTA